MQSENGPSQKISLSILIPCYNEEGCIAETVAHVRSLAHHFEDLEIIVINDGSTDRSAEILKTLPVVTLTNTINRGYGASLKKGLRHARHDYVALLDADGTYPVDDLPKLAADAASYDMVVGARTGAVVQVPTLRKPGKWLITRLAEYLSGQKIPDLNSGFRIFKKEIALYFYHLYPDGFSFTTTITLSMMTNNYDVKFVPINYMKRIGKSSIKPIRDFTNFCILITRVCAFYKPLNVFLPPAFVLILAGLGKGTMDYLKQGSLGLLAILVILTGLQMIFIALLADLIDHRMRQENNFPVKTNR